MVGTNNKGRCINLTHIQVIKNIANKHELSKVQHGTYIATKRLSKTCNLILSYHCRFGLEFMDVNDWKT